jgi:hypothetical protein
MHFCCPRAKRVSGSLCNWSKHLLPVHLQNVAQPSSPTSELYWSPALTHQTGISQNPSGYCAKFRIPALATIRLQHSVEHCVFPHYRFLTFTHFLFLEQMTLDNVAFPTSRKNYRKKRSRYHAVP